MTTGTLDLGQALEGARLVVVGGTGFLGKVWLSLLLKRFSGVGKIFLVVRSKPGLESERRFWADVAASATFDPLREEHQSNFEAFIREKITVLDADVSKPLCGVDSDLLTNLAGTIDALVNVAGVVDFNPPLDEAILTNARGMQNIVALARALGDVPVLHTSTCYVAGYRSGKITETDPTIEPFPKYEEMPTAQWSPDDEIAEGLELAAAIEKQSRDAHRRTAFEAEAKTSLGGRCEPDEGPVLEAEIGKIRRRWLSAEGERVGMERAKFWGWPNTYTYTKSLGEQVLAASGLRWTITRPSVIESSFAYPFAGWNEGINTMAPIMFLFMGGHMQIPWSDRTSLDVIPVDMVAGGMIAALAALLENSHSPVYHLATSDGNVLPMARLIEICGLYKRKHYQRTGKGNPWVNFVQSHWEPTPVSAEGFERHGAPAFAQAARVLSRVARSASVGPANAVLKPLSRGLDAYAGVAQKAGDIFRLFMPFMAETDYVFIADNMRSLCAGLGERDREAINWSPDAIDWRRYMHDIHLPGLEKWVLPELDAKMKRALKPLRAWETLTDLIDAVAERYEHLPAVLRTHEDGLATLTYRDLGERSTAAAARLHEAGVRPGDRVALCAANHPSWPIAYFGVLKAGAVVVPIDAAMEAAPLGNVLAASRAVAVVCDAEVRARIGTLGEAVTARTIEITALTQPDRALTAPLIEPLSRDDLASVIYTSGTTGTPKGVMLTHGNFASLVASLGPVFPLGESDRTLSVLPLHHTFEFTCGLLLPLARGASVLYLDELTGEKLVAALVDGRVTAMVGVPALWQLLERRIIREVKDRGPTASAIFDAALTVNRTLGRTLGVDLGRTLFSPVHSKLGGRLKYMISGGSALPRATAELFQGLGLPLSEGYGLTEAAPVLSVAKGTPKSHQGSVGPAIPGVELKVSSPDANGVGEVFARGANVMKGYADNENATAAVFDDGWLKTGDLGRIDSKGRLTLVGRSKDVVVGVNGENVYPDDVERLLGDIEHIKELVVLGVADPQGGERVAIVAVPELDGVDSALREPRRETAMANLRAKLKTLPSAWQPSVVLPWGAALPRTATRKVKRNEVRPVVERMIAATARPTVANGETEATSPVRHAIATIARKDPAMVTANTKLRSDLGFDSLMAMELAVSLETLRPGVQLPQGLSGIESVAEIEALLGVKNPVSETPRVKAKIEDKKISVPEPVQAMVKDVFGVFQRGFYENVMKPKVTGRAFIPYNRNTLIVANHSSHLDMGLVKYALGSYGDGLVTLAAKDYFFDTPAKRAFWDNFTNVAAFDRDAGLHQTLREVGRLLEEGRTVLIFPEGTRSTDGQLRKFKGAVGFIAMQHQIDILPVYLGGTYEALPKNSRVPRQRDITARIGPALEFGHLDRLTQGMRPVEKARTVARLAQSAVESLRDGGVLDLASLDSPHEEQTRRHPLVVLFEDLEKRFVQGGVEQPVSFYFTLGESPESKWTVTVSPTECSVINGRPEGSKADCVLKTSPELFTRIVREGWQPGATEFMAGLVKSNDVGLLYAFTRAFALG